MPRAAIVSNVSSAAEHYEALLAERYRWMFGDFDARVAAQRSLLELRLTPAWTASALEAAGFGIEHRGDERGMCSIVACATAS